MIKDLATSAVQGDQRLYYAEFQTELRKASGLSHLLRLSLAAFCPTQ